MPISKEILEQSKIKKTRKYYIKDGIKCTKRDIKLTIKQLWYLIGDLIIGYWELLTIKENKKRKGEKDNG